MYLPYISWGVEGTDKTVGSRDDLRPSTLKLRHHVVMLNSKHGSSRSNVSCVLPPTTSHTPPSQPTPSKWLMAPYIRLLYCREYDRHRASARISSNEMQMPLAEHMPPPTRFTEWRDFKIRWVLMVFLVFGQTDFDWGSVSLQTLFWRTTCDMSHLSSFRSRRAITSHGSTVTPRPFDVVVWT